MAWGALSGLKLAHSTTVALVGAKEEASPPSSPTKQAAMSGELVEPQPPAPTRQSSARGWEPDEACSCGCGSGDGRARRLEGPATHDGPRSGPPCRQSERRTVWPTRQTTREYRVQARASHPWGRARRSGP